ncbi:hypothetical protein WN943_010446 [Citrus x changshan-huyou]
MLENGYNNGDWLWPKTDRKDTNCMDTCHETCKRLAKSCSKVNENNSGAGALRYALHLRFLCPSPKKKSHLVQRCKSDPFSVPQNASLDKEGERRFYLYNDLRLCFLNAIQMLMRARVLWILIENENTEVIICWLNDLLNVEYHFPEDPRYFDIGN